MDRFKWGNTSTSLDTNNGNTLTLQQKGSQETTQILFYWFSKPDKPKTKACEKCTENANMWGCWPKDNPTCYPIAFWDNEGDNNKRYFVKSSGTKDLSDSTLTVDGIGQFKAHITFTNSPSRIETSSLNTHIVTDNFFNDTGIYERNADGTIVFDIEIVSGSCHPWNSIVPDRPKTNSPAPPADTKPAILYQRVGLALVSYNLSQFTYFRTPGVKLTLPSTFQNVTLHISPGELLDCPNGYQCYGATQASAWKCWQNPYGPHDCIPIADYRYGADLTPSKMVLRGGVSSYSISIKLDCNPGARLDQLEVTSAYEEALGNTIVFTASTSANCPVPYMPPIRIIKATAGGYFVIILWVGLAMIMGLGVVLQYALTGEMKFPFSEFWKEFGYCVRDGWKIITFERSQPNVTEEPSAEESGAGRYDVL